MTYVISCPFGWICSGNRKPGCQVDLNINISWPGRLFKLTFATCSVKYCDPCACTSLPDKAPARTPAAKTATHAKACLMFLLLFARYECQTSSPHNHDKTSR